MQGSWEEKAADQTELFRTLAENVPGVVYLCENDSRYTMHFISAPVEALTGYPASEFLADRISFVDLYHPHDAEAIVREVEAALARREQFRLVYRIRHANGEWRTVEEFGQGVFDERDTLRFLEGTLFDVTGRELSEQRLRQSEQRFRALAEAAFEGVAIIDDGSIVLVNAQFAEMFGRAPMDLVGRPLQELVAPEERGALIEELRCGSEGPHLHRAGGDQLPGFTIEIRFKAIPFQDHTAKVAAVRDVSDHYRRSTSLELLVQQRTAQLQRVNEGLRQERERLKDSIARRDREHQLLAYEIHDGLVQYATAATMQLQVVQSRLKEPDQAAAKSLQTALDLVQKTIAEARNLIGDLLPPVLQGAGLAAAIEYLFRESQWPAEIQHELVCELGEQRLDAELENTLFRIAQEALTNVRRHSQSPRVRVELKQVDDKIRLTVRDWGVGFEPAQHRQGGYGLRGIQQRAELQGGRQTIDSAPGEGTTITVEFPARYRQASADDDSQNH